MYDYGYGQRDYYGETSECSRPCIVAIFLVIIFIGLVIFIVFFSFYLADVNNERLEIANDDRKGGSLFIELRNSNLNPKFKLLFNSYDYHLYLRRRPSLNIERSLPLIQDAIDKFIKKCDDAANSSEGIPFYFTPGSVGIVTTCRLNALCISSLLFAYEQTQGKVPIELWLDRATSDFNAMRRIQFMLGSTLKVRFIDDINETYVKFFGEKIPFYKNNFDLKPLVMIGSSFQHMIWMDGDVMFVKDPRILIDHPDIKKSGMALWRDIACIHINNPIWRVMNAEPRKGMGGESGVVYINKALHWKSLYLAAFMNQNQHVFYRLVYGDKDTFFLAAERLKNPYHMMPYAPIAMGVKDRLYAFIQASPYGDPLFIHLPGFAKDDFAELVNDDKAPLTKILNYDPERSHLDYKGKNSFVVVNDRRTYSIPPLIPAEDYFSNSTLERFSSAYKLAQNIMES